LDESVGFITERGKHLECMHVGCNRPHFTRFLCNTHYNVWQAEGLLAARPTEIECQDCQATVQVARKGPITKLCKRCKIRRIPRGENANRDRVLMKYGITFFDYQVMNGNQNGRCAICDGPPNGNGKKYGRLSVDHDHDTGEIRGLLCATCNSGLGLFRDEVYLLELAARYLRFGPQTLLWYDIEEATPPRNFKWKKEIR
jgi:hypothetical protein